MSFDAIYRNTSLIFLSSTYDVSDWDVGGNLVDLNYNEYMCAFIIINTPKLRQLLGPLYGPHFPAYGSIQYKQIRDVQKFFCSLLPPYQHQPLSDKERQFADYFRHLSLRQSFLLFVSYKPLTQKYARENLCRLLDPATWQEILRILKETLLETNLFPGAKILFEHSVRRMANFFSLPYLAENSVAKQNTLELMKQIYSTWRHPSPPNMNSSLETILDSFEFLTVSAVYFFLMSELTPADQTQPTLEMQILGPRQNIFLLKDPFDFLKRTPLLPFNVSRGLEHLYDIRFLVHKFSDRKEVGIVPQLEDVRLMFETNFFVGETHFVDWSLLNLLFRIDIGGPTTLQPVFFNSGLINIDYRGFQYSYYMLKDKKCRQLTWLILDFLNRAHRIDEKWYNYLVSLFSNINEAQKNLYHVLYITNIILYIQLHKSNEQKATGPDELLPAPPPSRITLHDPIRSESLKRLIKTLIKNNTTRASLQRFHDPVLVFYEMVYYRTNLFFNQDEVRELLGSYINDLKARVKSLSSASTLAERTEMTEMCTRYIFEIKLGLTWTPLSKKVIDSQEELFRLWVSHGFSEPTRFLLEPLVEYVIEKLPQKKKIFFLGGQHVQNICNQLTPETGLYGPRDKFQTKMTKGIVEVEKFMEMLRTFFYKHDDIANKSKRGSRTPEPHRRPHLSNFD